MSSFALVFRARSPLAGVATGVALVACGGSTSSGTPANGDAGPGGADATALDAQPDVLAADADQPPDVYPATHHPMPQLTNFGGDLLGSVKVVTVTFVGDAWRDELRAFDDALVASPSAWWNAVTHSYGIDYGTSGGHVELPDTVSGKQIDNKNDIRPFIQAQVGAGLLPTPDKETLYAFFYPTATTVTLDGAVSCQDFIAYHDSTIVTLEAGTVEAAYAIMPRCDFGDPVSNKEQLTISASHEIVEAATDAHPGTRPAYYLSTNDAWTGKQGSEVADLCEGRKPATQGGYFLSRSWVNARAAASQEPCQPASPGEVFFGAAVETETLTLTDANGTYQSDGYIAMKRGESKDVGVDVFSEAALPGELSLVVGARSKSTDPSVVGVIGLGIAPALSKTSAHNGQHVTLTLTAAPNAQVGYFPFVVRAILNAGDYHSWPVILQVR